jgi:hypothetical protein
VRRSPVRPVTDSVSQAPGRSIRSERPSTCRKRPAYLEDIETGYRCQPPRERARHMFEQTFDNRRQPNGLAAMALEDDKGLGAGWRNANAEARDIAVPNLEVISSRPQISDGEISECGRFCHGQISLPDKSTSHQPDFRAECPFRRHRKQSVPMM